MAKLSFDLPGSLLHKLEGLSKSGRGSVNDLIMEAVVTYLGAPLHTLFQISTSRSLVAGRYGGAITCEKLLEHGDFGLGTFAGLNGEMVVLDGRVFRVEGNGRISEARSSDEAPFATVVRFAPSSDQAINAIASLEDLKLELDRFRRSDNLFYAFRIEGLFNHVKTRAVCAPEPGATLLDAAKTQHEFEFFDSKGTLVGIYSPIFSGAVTVPGYHFHYLSNDRSDGGHLLQIQTEMIRLQVQELDEFHLALPETEEFLKVDLTRDTSQDLNKAESGN